MISLKSISTFLPFIIFSILSILYWKIDVLDSATDQLNWWVQGDLYTYFYQMSHYAFSRLGNGEIPLWNPYQSCGMPFLATYMVGVFYPFNFLYLFYPTHLAMGYTTLLHIFLGGVFMYLYGRSIKLSTLATFVTSVTFMFSGWVLETMWRTPEINTCIWLPLVFFSTEMILQKRKFSWFIVMSIVLTMQILAGLMQMVVQTLYITCFYSIFRLVLIYRAERNLRNVALLSCYLCGGILMTFFLTAFQLFPAMELSSHSIRPSGGLSLQQADPFGYFFTPSVILKAIFNSIQYPYHPRWEYIGIIPITLSFLSLFRCHQKRFSYFFFGSGILFLFLSFGVNTPFFKLYHSLPTGDWFRIPTRFLYLFTFSFSVLSGIGYTKLVDILENKSFWAVVGLSIISMIVLYCTWILGNKLVPASVYIIFFVGVVWLIILFGSPLYIKLLSSIIPIMIIIDLFHVNMFIYRHPQKASGFFHQYQDVIDVINEQQGQFRSYVWFDPFITDFSLSSKIGTSNRINVINDYEPFSLLRYAEYVEFMILGKMDNPRENQYPFVGIYLIGNETKHPKLFNLLSAKYIITKQIPDNFPSDYIPIYQGNAWIFKNPNAIPRAFIANKVKVMEGKAILEELSKEEFNPYEYVILEGDIPKELAKMTGKGLSKVTITEDLPEKIVIDVNSQSGGVLVLADTFYPGWKAFIDGREEKIYRANYLFRAVPIECGEHTVKFIYKPESFYRGLYITICAMVFLGFIAAVSILKK